MKSPEKQVEEQIMAWAFRQNIVLWVFDSKGQFSESSNRYVKNQGIVKGCADLVGLDPYGFFVAIELKAQKKGKVCRLEQRQFLERVIRQGGFGAVVDSPEAIDELYQGWALLRQNRDSSVKFLLDSLPKKVLVNKKVLTLL